MKISIISTMEGFSWGGSEFLWATMGEQALRDGHEVLISIYDWSVDHTIVKNLQALGGYLIPRTRSITPPSLIKRTLNRLLKVVPIQMKSKLSSYETIFAYNPDIVCISQGGSYDIAYLPELYQVLETTKIPYVLICQFNSDSCSLEQSRRELASQILHRASLIAFVSQHNLKASERHLACSLPNALVVKNPINLTGHHPVSFPTSSTPSFACVARLETSFKGQDILLEALSTNTWRNRDWKCCLYGSGPDKKYLQSLAQHYGICDRVQFMGHTNDVRSIWEKNHILVLPSRGEGTPLSLVEAMLCGRPAVVTDVGGNVEWIGENETGFIAEAPNTKSLSAALERAWLNQDFWKQMGLAAHQYAKENIDFNPGKTLLQLVIDSIGS